MTIVSTGQDDEKMAEIDCYNFLDEIKQFLEFIPNRDFKNAYRLNTEGQKQYPQLIGHIFMMEQIEYFVFQNGAQINPLEMAIALCKTN